MKTANADPVPVMQEIFQQIATAQVGTSAWEAKGLGYLRDTDIINMNSDLRLAVAKEKALELVKTGVRPEPEPIYAAGRDVQSALKLGVRSFVWGNYASEHDALISSKLANILCGGNISGPEWVDPWYILDLEREAFLALLGEQKTLARIQFMLEKGKPLRN
jgi:3-hydroxyacyl-CoA dehydrogenase